MGGLHPRARRPVTEAVYQANPRLAELGPVLPAGYWLELPDTTEPAQQNIIQLWD
ncbi:TPA: tail protein X [Yersinia enterocolitica]|nr:tail protein X [Yersinia enterocolitica]HEB9653546.1 tail protein X [Yersinia enterocolitica]